MAPVTSRGSMLTWWRDSIPKGAGGLSSAAVHRAEQGRGGGMTMRLKEFSQDPLPPSVVSLILTSATWISLNLLPHQDNSNHSTYICMVVVKLE